MRWAHAVAAAVAWVRRHEGTWLEVAWLLLLWGLYILYGRGERVDNVYGGF